MMRVSIWTNLLALTLATFCLPALAPPALAQEVSLEEISRLAERGNRVQALRHLEDYLDGRPDHFAASLLKGNLLVEVGRAAQAEEIFTSLIQRFPDRPEAFNNLAVLQARQGRYEEAAESLVGALATHPSYRVAYQNLGKVYGQFASQAYSKALGVQHPEGSRGVDLTLLANLPPTAPSPPAELPAAIREDPMRETPPQEVPAPAPPRTAPAPEAPPVADPPVSDPPVSDSPVTAAPVAVPPVSAPPAAAEPPPAEDGIASAVRSWARAWSEQRIEAYLGFYSNRFRPDGGLTRSEWVAQRRQRLARPEYIRVVLRNLQTPLVSAERAVVTFTQSYSADNYSDVVEKRMVLVREGGGWKILEETSTP